MKSYILPQISSSGQKKKSRISSYLLCNRHIYFFLGWYLKNCKLDIAKYAKNLGRALKLIYIQA